MDKNINVMVVGLPIEQYDRKWLDTLSDRELSETALAEETAKFIYRWLNFKKH